MAIGIYKITNKLDGKVYVGQTANTGKRKREHFNDLRAGRHRNIRMQRAFIRDGEENFIFEVIEECSVDSLTQREQFWLDFFNTSYRYNICEAAESSRGVKRSEETKAKLSAAKLGKPVKISDEARKRGLATRALRWATIGRKKPSPEAAIKRAKSLKERWAKIPRKSASEETRKRMSESAKRRHLTKPMPEESIKKATQSRAARRLMVTYGS